MAVFKPAETPEPPAPAAAAAPRPARPDPVPAAPSRPAGHAPEPVDLGPPASQPRGWDALERTLAETLGRRSTHTTPESLAVEREALVAGLDSAFSDAPPIPGDLDADIPLEPGSGKPRPVAPPRAEADAEDKPKGEPSKADFIAAARRAAQQAAGPQGPAGVAVAQPPLAGSPRRAGLKRLAPSRRVLLVTAAVAALAIAGTVAGLRFLAKPRVTTPAPVSSLELPQPAGDETVAAVVPPAPDTASDADAETVTAALPPAPAAPAPSSPTAENAAADEADPVTTATAPARPVLPPIPPSALPDEVAVQPTPLGPASGFAKPDAAPAAGTEIAAAGPAPSVAPSVAPGPAAPETAPLPPEAVGPVALRQAAAGGDAAAQFEVGARYTEGRGVAQDLAEAARWYARAAAAGMAPAQYRLGSLYEKGQGVPRDVKTAEGWYRKAADAGNAKAMHNLAVLNAEGSLGAPDYTAAARWFESAADRGVRDSQYNLGILYARGLGVKRDLTASYKWFAIAAAGGDVDAAKKRDDVAQVLDKDALARARLAVETWRAETPDPAANDVAPADPAWSAVPENTASVTPLDPIATAQRLLAAKGYDAGPADGRMGQRTRDAVMAFQQARGLKPTGEVDAALLKALAEEKI